MFEEIRQSLADFGVTFDVYFNEKDLHDKGELDEALAAAHRRRARLRGGRRDLAAHDDVRRRQGPRPRQDRRRAGPTSPPTPPTTSTSASAASTGSSSCSAPTTTATSAATRRSLRRFGDDPDVNLEILIGQMVNLVQGRQAAADEQAGRHDGDPGGAGRGHRCRRRPLRARPVLDATARSTSTSTLWAKRTNDNPVYYVQYAHARVVQPAAQRGRARPRHAATLHSSELLDHDREGDLLGALGEFPRVVATAAELREPHRVARYLEELAGTYHRFYDACRVLPRGDEEVTDLHRARLWLVEATRIVLANGLRLLGVSAPERM